MTGLLQAQYFDKNNYTGIGVETRFPIDQPLFYGTGKFKDGFDFSKLLPGTILTKDANGFIEVGGSSDIYAGVVRYTDVFKDEYENPTTYQNMRLSFLNTGFWFTLYAESDITKRQLIVMNQLTGKVKGINKGDPVPVGYTLFTSTEGEPFIYAEQDSKIYKSLHQQPDILGVYAKININF